MLLLRYDYFTIMHIGCRAFSSIEGKTIEAKDDEVDDNDLGQRDGFSKSDIDRLKAAYVSSYTCYSTSYKSLEFCKLLYLLFY